MSDTSNTPNRTDARTEALSWLAGQCRWESLLADLQALAEKQASPVVELERRERADEESAA